MTKHKTKSHPLVKRNPFQWHRIGVPVFSTSSSLMYVSLCLSVDTIHWPLRLQNSKMSFDLVVTLALVRVYHWPKVLQVSISKVVQKKSIKTGSACEIEIENRNAQLNINSIKKKFCSWHSSSSLQRSHPYSYWLCSLELPFSCSISRFHVCWKVSFDRSIACVANKLLASCSIYGVMVVIACARTSTYVWCSAISNQRENDPFQSINMGKSCKRFYFICLNWIRSHQKQTQMTIVYRN